MSMPAEKPKLYPVNDEGGAVVKDIQENYSTGYINLFRSVRKHWVWQDAEKFKWWVDILLEANHKDQKVLLGGKLIECKRGQSVNSLLTWAKRWRTNVSAVRRFLKLLQSDSMIVLENVSKTTRLTICNYGSYNDKRNDNETIMKRKRNDDETIVKTNNNGNNDNNVNNSSTPAKTWRYSNKGFFDRQLANNESKEGIEAYRELVEFLHGKNRNSLVFENVLSLEKQISFKDFLQLREKAKTCPRTIGEVLASMENKASLKKEYKNVYLTVNNWLDNDFTKKK